MAKFTDLLIDSSLVKVGGPENPSQQQLESDFSELAYMFLQDRAGPLMQYLLGFETVTQEADGSRAIGIFGFKVGKPYYFVPVFFINNQIKGMDFIINKDTNMFLPLQEGWISHILTKETTDLGSAVPDADKVREDFESPDFDFLTESPVKKASHTSLYKFAFTVQDMWHKVCNSVSVDMKYDPHFKYALAGSVAKLQGRDTDFLKEAHSDLLPFIHYVGGPAAVSSIATTLGTVKYANAALSFYDLPDIIVTQFDDALTAPVPTLKPKLAMITEDDLVDTDVDEDIDKTEIVRHGFTMKDDREPSERSEVFPADYVQQFGNPIETGQYNVLLSSGTTQPMWIFMEPFESDQVVVYDPDSKTALFQRSKNVIVKGGRIDIASTLTPYDSASQLSRIRVGERYFLISEDLKTTKSFEAGTIKSTGGRTEIDIMDRPIADVDYLQLVDFESPNLRIVGNKLIVPSNWRVIHVKDSYSDDKRPRLGSMVDLDEALYKSAIHKLIVENPDSYDQSYHIHFNDFTEGPYTYKTAAWRLAKDYGIGVTDVHSILSEAHDNIKARRLLKLAQGVGVAMPNPQMPAPGMDPYTGAMTTSPYTVSQEGQFVGMPELADPMQQDPGGQSEQEAEAQAIEQEVMELVEQAEMTGQKSVFDFATIGGLASVYNASDIVDMYLPDMLKALDRLGRILFLYYWKNDEFSERYGLEDLSAMEDNLRSTFKSFGDLVLKLQEKSIVTNISKLM